MPSQLSRRRFNSLLISSLVAPFVFQNLTSGTPPMKIQRPQRMGTTFSPLQCYYLDIDYQKAFREVCTLNFDIIRLGSYWHEIEKVENQYNFSVLDFLLQETAKRNMAVVLTLGMKAPRWPEYHFPDWLRERYNTTESTLPLDANPEIAERILKLIQAVIKHTRDIPHVKYWQIENEPLTQLEIAAGRFLSYDFIQQEIQLTRQLARPDQKIVLTNAIHLPSPQIGKDDHAFHQSLQLADAVGINVYTKIGVSPKDYLEPTPDFWETLSSWKQQLQDNHKETWIAEAQAEPWEYQELVATKQLDYPSTSPLQVSELVSSLAGIGYETVMLWGCEYWYWHRNQGRHHWWKAMQQLLES